MAQKQKQVERERVCVCVCVCVCVKGPNPLQTQTYTHTHVRARHRNPRCSGTTLEAMEAARKENLRRGIVEKGPSETAMRVFAFAARARAADTSSLGP